MRVARTMIVGLTLLTGASLAHAQLRVGSWNLTEYGGAAARTAAFQTSLFGVYQGRTFAPDVIILQEVESASAASTFLALMNNAPGSPGGYALATFVNGNDSDSACIYRSSRLTLVGTTVAIVGDSPPSPSYPTRNVMRYQLRPVGYASAGAILYLYSAHLKASDMPSDVARRGEEATLVRNLLNTLPAGSRFIFGGDMNFYDDDEPAWSTLTGSQADNDGRLFDPINKAGNWHDAGGFASVHTQSPSGSSGGMDDRFDFLLVSEALSAGQGLSYIGNRTIQFGSGWNDPNHSFRVWGNDATTFNVAMRVSNNSMVGTVIAQALMDHFVGTGSPPHLPIFMDLRVPARIGTDVATIDFGTVALGAVAQHALTVTNTASVATFSKDGTGFGIDSLTYAMGASAGFAAPGSVFEEPADALAQGNVHQISIDTSSLGSKVGTLTIASDDPESPSLVLNLIGTVVSAADYDVNNDGQVNVEDLYSWQFISTDVDGNGVVNIADRAALLYELRRLEVADMTSGRR